jgi:phosphoribosylanthranilate isomerase
MKTRIKICGITNLKDACVAVEFGADALGFIFTKSPRQIPPEKAKRIIQQLAPFVTTVGVFMDAPLKFVEEIAQFTGIDVVQLHGNEQPEYCQKIKKRVIKRMNVRKTDTKATLIGKMQSYLVSAFLLDPGEGSGKTFDWKIAKGIDFPIIIAGGLNPENVGQAIKIVRPYGVDVSSGVEKTLGKKDGEKIKLFIKEVQ